MPVIKRLLTMLDHDESDERMASYLAELCRVAGVEQIHFALFAPTFDMPENLRHEFLGRSGSAAAIEQMRSRISGPFRDRRVEMFFEVVEGPELQSLISLSRQLDPDLITISRRCGERRNLAARAAHQSPCSILILPPAPEPRLERILVPLDFSPHSREALDIAVRVAAGEGLRQVYAVNIYHVPSGYHRTGRSYEEVAALMRKNAEDEYEEMMRGFDTRGVKVEMEFELHRRAGRAIAYVAERRQADLVALGSRGRTIPSLLLLGSVVEDLIGDCQRPLLVTKTKGHNLKLLEAIIEP